LFHARVALGGLGADRSGNFPADWDGVRQGCAEVDANARALFGKVQLEGQLFAILDLAPEKDAECSPLDQRIGALLGWAAAERDG
jgi:hypothetical protein